MSKKHQKGPNLTTVADVEATFRSEFRSECYGIIVNCFVKMCPTHMQSSLGKYERLNVLKLKEIYIQSLPDL